jgi:inositol-phosphate phosphatase / L-galactose 1-phosphate phosphatase / histidinol-phosphatase
MIPLDDLIALAHRLADLSGNVIRPYFRAGIETEGKADGSPVTLADRAAEEAIRAALAEAVPEHGVIGEEFGRQNEGAELVWVIDPIDGTKAFISGKPLFVTLIALLHHGRPLLGVIDQPILDERWIGAAGRETLYSGKRAIARRCSSLAEARLSTTGPQYFTEAGRYAFERVAARAELVTYGGDGYQYGLVTIGGLDVVIESGLKLHDWAALVPIITGAGGVVSDWQGRPVGTDGSGEIVAAGDARCHAEVLAVLSART